MGGSNGHKLNMQECPFCADPNLFESFTKGSAQKIKVALPFNVKQHNLWPEAVRKYGNRVKADAEQTGKYIRVPFYGKDFKPRWRDYVVEVFGIETAGEINYPRKFEHVWDSPPGPFFFIESPPQDHSAQILIRNFIACRVTHKNGLELFLHWWPSHGLKTISSGLKSVNDFDAFSQIMKLFRPETRGAEKKITDARLKTVLSDLGAEATQTSAARALKVSETALEKWRRRQGIKTWREVVNRFSNA